MTGLGVRGNSNITNVVIGGSASTNADCAFTVTAYESKEGGSIKYDVSSGEINYTKYDGENSLSISDGSEVALYVKFKNVDYRYKGIDEIYAINYDISNRDDYSTQVTSSGTPGVYDIIMYIPLAYIYRDLKSIIVKQYFCGNIDFTIYYTSINGAICFEFFKTFGIGPGQIPSE